MDEPNTLTVFANPYHFVDHKGRLAGVCACDTAEHVQPGDRRWVGARCVGKKTFTPPVGDRRSPETDVAFEFDPGPVRLPNTKYYVARLRDGVLFAADKKTATEAGLEFADPKKSLETARSAAIEEWKRHYGEPPAFAAAPAAAPAKKDDK